MQQEREGETMTDATTIRDQALDERALHQRMEWFFKKYAPADKREAAEFHADLAMVVQAVHRDASRETHALLTKALAVMPNPFTILQHEK
jgi:hypothetical protein